MSHPPSTAQRRRLRFSSLNDIRSDLARVEAAHARGSLGHLGRWPAGPILEHLGFAVGGSIDGIPAIRFPWYFRFGARLARAWVLNHPLKPGVKLNAEGESAAWNPNTTFEDGLRMYLVQLDRAEVRPGKPNQAMNKRHPLFGALTPEEWMLFHLRHAELHLGFVTL